MLGSRLLAAIATAMMLAVPLTATTAHPKVEVCPDGEPTVDVAVCPAEEGSRGGTLVQGANEEDTYRFDPGEASLVRVAVEAEGRVEAALTDPTGDTRAVEDDALSAIELVAAGLPEGDWTLTIRYLDGLSSTGYSFDFGYEHHDHVRAVQAPVGDAATVVSSLPADGFAFFEASLAVPEDTERGKFAGISLLEVETDASRVRVASYAPTYGGYGDEPHAWTEGRAPEDVAVSLPELRTGTRTLNPAVEAEMGFTLCYGLAVSDGVERMRGWAVWDGSDNASLATPDGKATFDRLADFEAGEDGHGVQLGHDAYAENLTNTYEAPDDHATILAVNSHTPELALEPARFNVTDPAGPSTQLTGGGPTVWFPRASGVQPGPWDVRAEHVEGDEGDEGDEIRLAAASFPFTLT